MISYELAKQLKDAGFPQEEYLEGEILVNPEFPYPADRVPVGKIWMEEHKKYKDGLVYAPTLSELIEACGDWFYNLLKSDDGKWHSSSVSPGYKWKDSPTKQPTVLYAHGDSPEEAVSRLYLLLHSKDNEKNKK